MQAAVGATPLPPAVGPSSPGPEEKERQPAGKASAVVMRQAVSQLCKATTPAF